MYTCRWATTCVALSQAAKNASRASRWMTWPTPGTVTMSYPRPRRRGCSAGLSTAASAGTKHRRRDQTRCRSGECPEISRREPVTDRRVEKQAGPYVHGHVLGIPRRRLGRHALGRLGVRHAGRHRGEPRFPRGFDEQRVLRGQERQGVVQHDSTGRVADGKVDRADRLGDVGGHQGQRVGPSRAVHPGGSGCTVRRGCRAPSARGTRWRYRSERRSAQSGDRRDHPWRPGRPTSRLPVPPSPRTTR